MTWFESIRHAWPWVKNPYGFLERCVQQEESFPFPRHMPVMGKTLFTGDADLIRFINNHPDLAAGKGIVALRPILGDDSLIMLDDDDHAKRKKAVYPSFHGTPMKRLDRAYFDAAERMAKALPKNETFPIYQLLHDVALEAITKFMFGEQTQEELDDAMEAVNDFLYAFSSSSLLFLKPLQRNLGPFSPWGRAVRTRTRLRHLCHEHIAKTRAGKKNDGVISEITLRAEDLSDDSLITEVLTLLMFGHDTSAQTMTWAIALLHQNQESLEKVREEVNAVSLEDPLSPNSFPYLQACINESMRMRPVVVHITRVVNRPLMIGDVELVQGDRVAPSPWLTHHNPSYWPNPSQYDPERFLGRPPAPFTWLPFGIGQRTCIGRAFAQRQMPMIFAGILRNRRLKLAANYTPAPERNMVLIVPKDGCPMQVEP